MSWLTSSLVYLAAAVLAVPIARLLGLGAILGYLGAGIVIGPWGLGLAGDAAQTLHVAELGVVLMLFLVGLELEPARLWAMRYAVFGWGSAQLLGSAALVAGVAWLAGTAPALAVVAGLGLAMSSTAIGLAALAERNLLATTSGRAVLSVALLQDVAAIPILAFVPLLGAGGGAQAGHPALGAVRAVAVIAAFLFVGRLALRPALRWIARSRTPEIFTAAALLLVLASAALMQAAGLSMALGAFLAGVLLAESEYRRELETDIEPFKGLLLGLFFIAVGMSIDFAAVRAHPGVVALVVLGFLALKAGVLWAMARALPIPGPERPVFIVLLAQGGEFGFVVFQAAAGAGAIEAQAASLLVAAVAISMLATPLLLVAADRWWIPRLAREARPALAPLAEAQHAPVVIAGFGRYGGIVGRLLYANGLDATVLDHDAEQVEAARRFGWRVHYGDATRLDLLRTAGAAQAKVFVLAIDDVAQSVAVARLVREHFPQLALVARARNVTHWHQLRNLGVELIERETLDSALMSARSVLTLMGFRPHEARTLALRFRAHTIEQLELTRPHAGDERRLIALARQGREQLEQLFAQERDAARRGRRAADDAPRREAAGAAEPVE